METSSSQRFTTLFEELCSVLSDKGDNKGNVNSLIDELNALPYKAELFVPRHDAGALINVLCFNIKPADEFLSAKTSHLINSIITKQNIQLSSDFLWKVISWHIECLKKCSEMILLDILHNLQYIMQSNPQAAYKFAEVLIGEQGILINILDVNKNDQLRTNNSMQICLLAFKCILCVIIALDEKKSTDVSTEDVKEHISEVVIKFLMKGITKSQDEFLYCKVVISALRVAAHLYFHDQTVNFSLPEAIGICRHFMLYGLVLQNAKPERIMPSQQTIASTPIKVVPKGGKKQKLRKPRNNAIESLKKEIPVSDHSLMKDVDNFENNSAYKPVTKNYLEPQRARNCWTLTSDSDMSDVENCSEAKMVALKSRVRQSAANLFLVLFKVKEKREVFGYWWALLPDSPDVNNWHAEQNAKKTLAYCAVMDPIASSRASALSVILALLSGSKMYLAQAEISKKDNASFIPFSVSLGYIITCMHKVLTGILDNERSHSVVIVALKCCAALVQATPYHKMHKGLIIDLISSTRRFLMHRDITLQFGALITMGCVLSVEPKVSEILDAMQVNMLLAKETDIQINKEMKSDTEECDDFEEGYSDDEVYETIDTDEKKISSNMVSKEDSKSQIGSYFKSWILDICFKNIGWLFKGEERLRCKPSPIPIMQESLQVISSIAYHHLSELLKPHVMLLADVLCELLQHEHPDVVLQTARTVSVVADGIQKLEQLDEAPPLNQCVYMWEKLLTPLSSLLQCNENPSAKAVVCDCIANIGEKSFKELPNRQQMLCCALLMGSCSDEEATVRAAAVRALAMAVMFRTLREDTINYLARFVDRFETFQKMSRVERRVFIFDHVSGTFLRGVSMIAICAKERDEYIGSCFWNIPEEDICFVSDCGENVLRALAEPALVVRVKAAWALGNLSDALVLNMDKPELDYIGDDLLMRLLEVSNKCAIDNDKVKMSATRALGNLLRLINKETLLHNPRIKTLCETATERLLECACKVSNMKVRWNACYALGNAMKNEYLFTCFSGWQALVFPNLCTLARECKNLKVRINAVVALRSCSTRLHLGKQLPVLWRGVMAAMETAAHLDDFTEYKHKDNLVEQLCVTLAHICCLLKPSDLTDILDPLIFHGDCAKSLYSQVYHKLPPENASCLKILQAAKFVTMDLTPENDTQAQASRMLQEIFILDL